MLRVELLQLAHHSEANVPETIEGNDSFVNTLISLLCGIICSNEQYNKPIGKATSIAGLFYQIVLFHSDDLLYSFNYKL